MTARVLISDKLSPAAVEIFKRRGIEVDLRPGLAPAELRAIIGEYDGLAIRSATKVTKELLEAAPKLRVVGRAGIGVDNVDVKSATARGVVVMNTPNGNAITTAEHAIGMMFALARQIPEASSSTRAGKWEKNRFMGVELTGKTLGLIGCGNIGSIVAERAVGLHMRVVAYDPYLTEKRAVDLGVEKVELAELLARADIITLHTPLTDATRNILGREALAACKRGVRLMNCARGGLVDEAALAEALKSGQVAGAALDVFETEPATASPLFELENVVCTPHLGAATLEAQENVALQVAEQMSDFLLTGAVIERDQHAVGLGRGCAAAQAVYGAVPAARAVRGPAQPGQRGRAAQRRDRVRGAGGEPEPPSAQRGGARRPAVAADGGREHGQRPGGGARARPRRGRDGA